MKKFSVIAVLTVAALLVFASFAMAAPGNYEPDTTSALYEGALTETYTDGAGNVYAPGYDFLDPRNASLGNPRQVMNADGVLVADDELAPWNIFNANYTGDLNVPYYGGGTFNTYQRNVTGQLVHTDFQLNTNSCASCHMTHTAQSRKLLFRNGVYTTCAACHDGTLGFLNVFAAPTVDNPFGGSKTAGTFGANHARNASIHLANDSITISAAPGGNRMAGTAAADNGAGASWASDFNCGSCHGPHGSYSIRLLHANPNNIALRARETNAKMTNTGGLWKAGYPMVAADYPGYVKKFTATGWTATNAWYYGYPGGATTGPAALPGRWPRFATRIYAPTLYNPNSVGGPMAAVDGVGLFNNRMSINYGGGYAYFKDADQVDKFLDYILAKFPAANGGVKYATIDAFLADHPLVVDIGGVVKVTAQYNYNDPLTATEDRYKSDFINTTTYSGNVIQATGTQAHNAPYNLYCAACHVDYLGGSASSQGITYDAGGNITNDGILGTGVYSKAFRHTINRGATGGGTMQVKATGNAMLCVSCHFAHGVDSSFMSLADATLVKDAAGDDALQNDINTSSALKRYINMAVCWSCHANSSAATLKNSQWYWDGYTTDTRGTW